MRTKKNHSNGSAEKTVRAIRREQINQNLYYRWSQEGTDKLTEVL